MLTQDLQIINDVRLLCINAQSIYEELAERVSDQYSRNVLKRLAKNRTEIVIAITSEENNTDQVDELSGLVPENIRKESNARGNDLDTVREDESIAILIAKEKREITYLRNEVKRIKNYTLRCRLSSYVATLQMDFDQLQSLAAVPKTVRKGD